eukprot:TRINITY_DN11121_c0_g1_i1.p2 TRINITY_DN11121_c0_g1~~TRINITY_DN11121_c0_g1_i1.p2  ORF type:complete len:189 (+),score=58.42 TRINITY_DN11121_c0_g1_i1:78-569(+)
MSAALSRVAHLDSYHPAAPALAHVLESFNRPAANHTKSGFDARKKCPVSATGYFARLIKHARASPSCFVTMFVLLDRFSTVLPLDELNLHRAMAAALVIAVKLSDDDYFANSFYAHVCGVPARELLELERLFLSTIDWDLAMSPEDHGRVLTATAKYMQQHSL